MKHLKVKNWEEFQHYKDRSPPWIKLHRDLLRNYDFIKLSDKSKLHLMLIWLLASQMDNKIPADPKFIKLQIGVNEEIDFKELIGNGFLIDDSDALADRKRGAIVETETEAYSTEVETDYTPAFEELWLIYPALAAKGAKNKAKEKYIKLIKKGISHEEIIRGTERYRDFCQATDCFNKHVTTWLNQSGWTEEWSHNIQPARGGNKNTEDRYANSLASATRKAQETLRMGKD